MLWGTLVNCCGEIILSNNKYSFNYRELIYLRKNLAFVKKIFGLIGFFGSSLIFTLPSHSSLSLGEWVCNEKESYIISNMEFKNGKYKKYPTDFLKISEKNLKVFNVSYDLKKRIATINGSNAIISEFNEHNPDINKYTTFEENTIEDIEDIEVSIIEKDNLFPVTLISSYESLETKTENNAGVLKDSFIENREQYKKRNFFIIDNHLKNNSNFTAINLSSQDNLITIIGSNDKSSEKFESEKLIEVSVGKCKSLKIKN